MRIAMFSDSYYPYVSGVTRAVATAKETLTALGHQVTVFCPDYPGASLEEDVVRFSSIKAPTYAGYYVAVPFPPEVRRAVRKFSPDIIHIHSPFNLGTVAYRIGRRESVPVVLTYHTMYSMYSHYFPVIGRRVSRSVERAAFRVARLVDAVITPSAATARYLEERGAVSRVIPIPNGIAIEEFQGGNSKFLHESYGVPSDKPVVLTCGRLGLEKNFEVLLTAFKAVTEKVNASLVLVGDGPLKEALESKARSLNIEDSTFFIGSVPPNTMPSIYSSADIFMFTSLTDTQGLVLVEAKAAGLPAVAVGALGVLDMVQDGVDGYLCKNDPGEIARKALWLLEDPILLSTMSRNCSRTAQNFSREACAQKLLECYYRVRQA